jgi:hypothetical protein
MLVIRAAFFDQKVYFTGKAFKEHIQKGNFSDGYFQGHFTQSLISGKST